MTARAIQACDAQAVIMLAITLHGGAAHHRARNRSARRTALVMPLAIALLGGAHA